MLALILKAAYQVDLGLWLDGTGLWTWIPIQAVVKTMVTTMMIVWMKGAEVNTTLRAITVPILPLKIRIITAEVGHGAHLGLAMDRVLARDTQV
jgi:hypothetical protein